MSEGEAKHRPPLRLIRGGRATQESRRRLRLARGPRHRPPFRVDALVLEEDSYLVLSTDPRTGNLLPEHPIRVMTSVLELEPRKPGSVVVRERFPLEILAIVHDLDEDPSWREDWVLEALDRVLDEIHARRLRSVGMEILGSVYGRMPRQRFLSMLHERLSHRDTLPLEKLWLVTPQRGRRRG